MLKTNPLHLLYLIPVMAWGSLNIPITVKDGAKAGNASEVPVKIGVPLPMGAYEEVNAFCVRDASGNAVPAQFTVLGRWLPHSTSIRVVLVQFLADVVSSGQTQYYLNDNGSGNSGTGVVCTETPDHFIVNTGKLRFEVRKSSFNIIDNLWFDADGNGRFDPSEQMIASGESNGAALTTTGGAITRDTSKTNLTFQVEESGPIRFALRVESPTDSSADGWGFLVRIYAYYNQPYVSLDYYLKNSAYGAVGHHLNFSKFSLINSIKNLGASRTVRLGGALNDNTGAFEGAMGSASLKATSDAWQKFTVNGSQQTGLGIGYADISDNSKGVMAVVRKFSNLWPTGLEVTPGNKLSVNLWPEGRTHTMIDQTRRAHQVMLYFHGPATQADLFKQARLFHKYPVPALKPSVYAAAHAIGDYGGIYQADTTWNEALYTPPSIPANDSDWTGWWNWGGDVYRRQSADYGGWPFFLTNYISCGSPEAFYYMDDRARHDAEMRPMWVDNYVTPRDAGFLNINYVNAPHPCGSRPPYGDYDGHKNWTEWDFAHIWLFEYADFYFFSGERYCAENMKMVTEFTMQEWNKYMFQSDSFDRTMGENLRLVVDAYKMTGNERYLDFVKSKAEWIVDHYTHKFGVFFPYAMQHGNFSTGGVETYFLLPEKTPKERELKERYLLMLEGATNGITYWAGAPFDATPAYRNSWGLHDFTTNPYVRPTTTNYMTNYALNSLGMLYFLMGDTIYRNVILPMNVPYFGTAPINMATATFGNLRDPGNNAWFRVSSAAWYDRAAKKAALLPQINDLDAPRSFAKKVTLNWTSVGGNAYRIHWAVKPIVERFDSIAGGTIYFPHPDTTPGITNLYRCYAIDAATMTPGPAGQKETLTVGPLPDSLVGRNVYFDIQAVNIVSSIDQSRSPLSNTDFIALNSAGTDTPISDTTPLRVKEVYAMNSGEIMATVTAKVNRTGPTIGVSLTEVAANAPLTIQALDLDTACRSLFRIRTSGLVERKEYKIILSGVTPESGGAPITDSLIFTADFGTNIFSVRKFNFGSGYSGSGYEGDHMWNGLSGYSPTPEGYYTSRNDLATWYNPGMAGGDTASFSFESMYSDSGPVNSLSWFGMRMSTEIKDYRLKVCAGRFYGLDPAIKLTVEDSVIWDPVPAVSGQKYAYVDSIPLRIEDGMLDVRWNNLCYVNLWPVFHFDALGFTSPSVEKDGLGKGADVFLESYPNPFNPATQIVFAFGNDIPTHVRIGVYDIRGRQVADLTPAGPVRGQTYRVEWGCRDRGGKATASQVFILRLTAGKRIIQKTIILLK